MVIIKLRSMRKLVYCYLKADVYIVTCFRIFRVFMMVLPSKCNSDIYCLCLGLGR